MRGIHLAPGVERLQDRLDKTVVGVARQALAVGPEIRELAAAVPDAHGGAGRHLVGTGQGFSITGNTCSGRSMASGDSCQVQVVFSPVGTGARSATLTIPTDASGADTSVDLTGTATAPPVVHRNSRVQIGGSLPRLRAM